MRLETLLAAARKQDIAALDARLLLQEAAGLTAAEIIADPARDLGPDLVQTFNGFIARRAAREPVSRIIGWREFYGRRFKVTPDVLDPRPDTECVVDLALRLFKAGRFVDLGAGSGIIAATLCAENSEVSGVAVDVSEPALKVARENATVLGVASRIAFRQGSWLAGLDGRFDLIISNPPYIRDDAALMPEVAGHDPHLALFGGRDGLDAYRAIATHAAAHLQPLGVVIVEGGAGQDTEIKSIFRDSGFEAKTAAKDLAGHLRALAFGHL